jgi:hypothetical protein
MCQFTFSDAVKRLGRYGIKGHQVYFIDLVLLCEMSWADGIIQEAEREIVYEYLCYHVDSINRLAGCKMLEYTEARQFIEQFLDNPPDKEMCETIRDLMPMLRMENREQDEAEKIRLDILNACLDIASSSVTKYPYGICERFTAEEKEYYHKLEQLLTGKNDM